MKVSVLVPVLNEEGSVAALIEGLGSQTRPPDEIVITDGGSADRTVEIINGAIARGAAINLVISPGALPGRGRNVAAANAQNEWIAFTDAGTRPEADWLEILIASAESDNACDAVFGAWEPVTDSLFKECAAMVYLAPHTVVNGTRVRTDSVVSLLMKRSLWERSGGFPETLRSAEDILFMTGLRATGARIVYEPKALVRWQIQPTLWLTFKRFVTYSRQNIRAGLFGKWQAPVLERYILLLFLALIAIPFGTVFLFGPLLLWIVMIFARAAVSLFRNRIAYPASTARTGLRFLVMVPILIVIDFATILGTMHWLLLDKLKFFGARHDSDCQR